MSDSSRHAGLDRRDFLKILPAGAAALTLASSKAHAALLPDVGDGRLPLAHFPLPQTASQENEQDRGRGFDAYRLKTGDAGFLAHAARLTLHGLYPAEALWEYTNWAGLQVEVVYNRAAGLRQIAWCCENRLVPNIGSASSVRVPILSEQGLCLAGILSDHQDRRHTFELRLATGREPGMAKLQRGLYLAALSPHGTVNWRSFQLNPEGANADQQRLLYRRMIGGERGEQASFPYLAFSVDYAEKLPV
jgi:hypothetical protein